MSTRESKIAALKKRGWFPWYSDDYWYPPGTNPSQSAFGYSLNEAFKEMHKRLDDDATEST